MDSIRVERLRCLGDTGYIQLKPITVLLGQNSSGKSSFLRILPLLKQSLESRTTGPILWSGRLVDFGNFEDAHQTGAEDNIEFSFNFKLESRQFPSARDFSYFLFSGEAKILNTCDITLTLQVSENKKKETTRTSRIFLQLEDSKIQLSFGEDDSLTDFFVNSFNVLNLGNKYVTRKFDRSLILPTITESEQKKEYEFEKSSSLSPGFVRYRSRFRALFQALIDKTKETAHHATKLETIIQMALSFGLGNSENMLKDIQENNIAGKSWKNKTKNWTVETKDFKDLRDLIIANAIPFILEKCDDTLANFSKNISYIGPVRATAERYYRTQDLAVDEVDYQGNNLAMFLRNLTDSEMKNFSTWTLDNFGFKPSIKSSLGHISVKIRSKNSDKYLNVADTGFGFSQILPVITQLWLLSSFRRVNRGTITYAIEQPELHLHPRLQGTLTDALVKSIKAAKEKKIQLRLMIETHSEVLVNRLGQLVAEGKISPDEINIVLFEPSDKLGEVTIRNAQFDSDGYLLNWPLGFFEMELV
ncbi:MULTISPECIES: AAA family ATPase [unclassified Microcoleus]|uniref:AAA family ATPase n=1 Tax=unclassified Microcoleus TaxID=2642155 RepID=UPI0025E2276A|nr:MULTISPECIES: AAA family ATPase [unclassified Microcoleus]